MSNPIVSAALVQMVCHIAVPIAPAGQAWACINNQPILVAESSPLAHPDLPPAPMCDPMPTFSLVCRWAGGPGTAPGWPQCPVGYRLVNVVIAGHCPN